MNDGESPGDITVGALRTTRMACPADVMEKESRFLLQLSAANKIGFMSGQLMVRSLMDGVVHTLLFSEAGK